MSASRVVSLVPSATETLVALGVVPVACTRYCDLAGVPTVGGTKNPDVGAIVALAPDLVIVNDEENRVEDAAVLTAAGVTLHSMSPHSIEDVGAAVRALADAVEVPVPVPFDAWIEWLASTRAAPLASVFVAIWRRPWMTLGADTYASSLLAHLGFENVFADAAVRYPPVDLAAVATRAPALVLLPDEPYAFGERHVTEVEAAVHGARVVLVDGRDLFWWGIRTPAAVGRLRELRGVA